MVIKDLLQNKQGDQPLNFVNDDGAIKKWGSFLGKKEKTLLVLDDVWSDSIIRRFKFKLRGYTILVTSRNTFTQFNTYHLKLLNDKDATKLFRHSAFSEGSEQIANVPESLVDEVQWNLS
ncbi:probable disease resistance protein [Tanacetum coccineum]